MNYSSISMINVYTMYTWFMYIMSMFFILANLYLPYFFWGVPSAACLPFESPLENFFALRINISFVVHQNHFGPETRCEQMMLYYYCLIIYEWWSYVLTSVFWRVSSSEFDSCSLLQGNLKRKFTNLKSELNFKMNEIHFTYHNLPHFEKIVDST